ncbi:hypothetical protein [Dyadobacter fermentans]|uniref:hypothetical protein n=1 Tax=Dyadobacter fermentans TaxID=94254 RepID=UPI001CBA7B9C|nr:hypothetical protein [Dyadobacter fermentans]MBZ1361971.1 hypothetical protein [Dyadobacter fermentans]
MKPSIAVFLIAFLVGCKKKEVDPHLLPEKGIVINLCPSGKADTETYFSIPDLLRCGAPAITVGNIIASLSRDELSSPSLDCKDSEPQNGQRIKFTQASAIRLDVSYYKNIGRIVFDASAFNDDVGAIANCRITLNDTDGKTIEVITFASMELVPKNYSTTKNMANLKEVVITCGRSAGSIGDITLMR